jgi:hypothetical protein
MDVFLQFKSARNDCFRTVSVKHKTEPMPHHERGLQYTATGYGSKLPTETMIQYASRWRRVY